MDTILFGAKIDKAVKNLDFCLADLGYSSCNCQSVVLVGQSWCGWQCYAVFNLKHEELKQKQFSKFQVQNSIALPFML